MNGSQISKCLLCGETAKLLEHNYPGYMEPERFQIYWCPHCNTSFALPMVDTKAIYELIYKNGDKVPDYNRYWSYKDCIKNNANPLKYLGDNEAIYWGVISALKQIAKPKETIKIIEIGCGLGYLTYALVKEGYNATGLDISQQVIEVAKKTFGNYYVCADLSEYSVAHKASYDIIILTEVIEHIEEPLLFCKQLTDLLCTNGGKIILTTPNKTIYPAHIIWNTDLPPVHLWWFSENSMRHIGKVIGANVQFINFRKYHIKKHAYITVRHQRRVQNVKSVFNRDGEIIEQIYPTKMQQSKLRSIVIKIPFVRYLYHKINPRFYVCAKRSWVLGVVFEIIR